ncbi:hypothetical protein Hypma_000365 [Hypsizygus marmoreus]|uniref:Uncharacterized protein n=1 Tax=Hypsizygus marmoreus TaxID=39966 RepID=A0A369JG14_HYPMA|nr:hypothetical protein Hypma_000365 [Hypsizygus marmoreus]
MSTPSFKHPTVWQAGNGLHKSKWMCRACNDNNWRDFRSARRHEDGVSHQQNTAYLLSTESVQTAGPLPSTTSHAPLEVRGALAEVLRDMHSPYPAAFPPPPLPEANMSMELDYDAVAPALENFPTPVDPVAGLAASLQEWLESGPDTAPSEESSDDEDHAANLINLREDSELLLGIRRRRTTRANREAEADSNWYPWTDKITCVLDILRHLPRSIFSDDQMRIILWGMEVLGVNGLPSVDVMKDIDVLLQSYCGVDTIRYQGAFGHIYYVNDLGKIIAQEIANPRIGKHLRYYPEDSGQSLEQCWQAQHWLRDMDPTLATPMIRVGNQDFYVFEPTKLRDGSVVVPERWFTRKYRGQDVFFAKAWRTRSMVDEQGPKGYVVLEHDTVDVSMAELLLSMPHLAQTYVSDNVPDPRYIIGVEKANGSGISPWTLTNPVLGNRYREVAKGHRVVSFMMWLYCDDTSGNVSKKWNKHNSFLFTPAGLPRSMAQQETNIHFLSTSNIAPPLEMLDGIVSQLETYQTKGIWAWDADAKEMVLVIPVVLAMLGDNPMQSEIACHIGLKGKFFCRNCWVKGSDAADREKPPNTAGGNASDAGAESDVSAHSQQSTAKKPRQKHKETLQELVDRAQRFLGVSQPRHKGETIHELRTMFEDAIATGGKTRYGTAKTRTGLKDNFLEFFMERVFSFRSKQQGSASEKATAVKTFIERSIPKEPFSPVWKIKGLDPHQDTPVEILHVILLGFIKYLWRDVISRLKPEQKALLITRLNSFNTAGLGFSPLAGQTLVQYAGSLTGRDFRVISQAAPFVLYDLVPIECFETWLALSAMVPLIWQPAINNLEDHLHQLEQAIEYFLSCTARWTPRWFNKPKFHLLLHLLAHIRRFGPAILFATEGFESFNAVVRDHSVHSNRLAPSRDIGRGMARCNRIRHLLSGGFFKPDSSSSDDSDNTAQQLRPLPFSDNHDDWRIAGPYALAICKPGITRRNVIADYLGFAAPVDDITPGTAGAVRSSNQDKRWLMTQAGHHLPDIYPDAARQKYNLCDSVTAANGDICLLQSFILVSSLAEQPCLPIIGRIVEVLQSTSSISAQRGDADSVLLEEFVPAGPALRYRLPSLRRQGWRLVNAKTILCQVNVQHNCFAHRCDDKGSRTVYQEREATSHTRPSIQHFIPDDLILNTAQMRDAIHVQRFRLQADPLDQPRAILEGATRELEAQKAKSNSEKEIPTARKRKQPDSRSALAPRTHPLSSASTSSLLYPPS